MTYLNHSEEQIQFNYLSKTSPFWLSYSQEVHMLNTVKLKQYCNDKITKAAIQGRINHCRYG